MMLIKVSNIKLPVGATKEEAFAEARKKIGATQKEVLSEKLLRRSVDARRGTVQLVFSVAVETEKHVTLNGTDIIELKRKETEIPAPGEKELKNRPIIAGFGPCGMFCALTLARMGYRPLVLERGADVDTRTKKVEGFWHGGDFDKTTNVQFGEGGAGTFSDGKLTTRIGDGLIDSVLEDFVQNGAPEDILYQAMPHIGTDVLKGVVKSIREEIISLGGEVRFLSQITDIKIQNGAISAVVVNEAEEIPCELLVLSIGHSARDTYEMLLSRGVSMIQKPFSVGFRTEHLQEDINRAMYGKFAHHPDLGAAPYQVSYREEERGCYSFCMCPGGSVVCASSEEDSVVVNGMSERARDGKNANSAICVNVSGQDFGSNHPLAGMAFQRSLEQKAFQMGGGDYSAPVQLLGDYISGTVSKKFGRVQPSVLRGSRFADLNELLPADVGALMKKGFARFEKSIRGFAAPDTVLTGVETRTSAPVRIPRNAEFVSESTKGLLPAGEGAGYAGGIVSAAVDGRKIAYAIVSAYRPF